MTLQVKPGTTWDEVYAQARAAAPEAFDADRILNLHGGDWQRSGVPGEHVTPVDGTPVQGPPRVTHDEASAAVVHAHREHDAWTRVDLDERKARVQTAVDGLAEVRDTLALLLAWEIGKPWKLACADVDRALDGVRWYLGEIDRQLQGRTPAARSGQQHRVVELPDERAGPRRARAVPGRQRRRRQDPVAGRLPHPHARARGHEAGRPARDAAVGRRLAARRRAHPLRGDRLPRLRRRPGQRPQGRDVARRHRQAPLPRAGGPERLGRLGLLEVGRAGRPPHQGLRVRQAALHRLPALRRAARAGAGLPRDVPAGRQGPALRPPARGRAPRRRPARPALRPAHLRGQGRRPARAVRRGRRRRRHPALPRARSTRAASSTARTPPRTPRPPRCSTRRRRGRCATPSRSGRSTRSSWSTARPSCSRR